MFTQLDELLNIIGNDEVYPIMSLIDAISNIIENYENQNIDIIKKQKVSVGALKSLMQSHNLKQSDLSEIASHGVMSEILFGLFQ